MPYWKQHITPLLPVRFFKNEASLARIVQVLTLLLCLFFPGEVEAQLPTTITITVSTPPTCFGETATFTAFVEQPGVTGDVSFWNGANFLGTVELDDLGVGSISVPDLPAGINEIHAVYEGDAVFDESISESLFYTVHSTPVIITQPSSLTAFTGCSPVFNVVIDGEGPFIYQWRKNGSAIPNSDYSSYTRNNISAADAGNYSVVVTNTCGSVTSGDAVLTVTPRPTASISYSSYQWCATENRPQFATRTGAGGGIFEASPAGLDIDPATGTIIPSNSIPGTYIVIYSIDSESACPAIATRWVTVLTSPVVSIHADYCEPGGAVKLSADLFSSDPATYSWNTGETSPDILINSSGLYSLTAISSQGCEGDASLFVNPNSALSSTESISVCQDALPYRWNNQLLMSSGTYRSTFPNINGCDSTVMLTFTVRQTIQTTQDVSVCENALPYNWNNQLLAAAGTYTATLRNIYGCDSVVTMHFSIRPVLRTTQNVTVCEHALPYRWNNQLISQAGIYNSSFTNIYGCDSTITLELNVRPTVTTIQDTSICENELPFQWNHLSITAAGTYSAVPQNMYGCDSTVILHLSVNSYVSSVQDVAICQNELPYRWNNQTLNAAGTYTATYRNRIGCDSVVTLNLSVHPSASRSETLAVCRNALPFSWNGQSLVRAGTYFAVLPTVSGCDSVITLSLSVNFEASTTQRVTICESALPYRWNNQVLSTPGIYTTILKTIYGCDSTVTLNLDVNSNVTSTQNITICENALPYSWNNRSLIASGTYTTTLKNINGCDSTVTLNLAVHPNVSSTQNVTICENALPYSWNNRSLTSAGTYITSLTNINGCDSVVTLNLTVNPNVSSTQGITICENALPYNWNNRTLTTSGTYTAILKNVNGCDSVVTLNLTVNPNVTSTQEITICENALPYNWNNRTLTTAGTYTAILKNINGCDSTVTLHLAVHSNVSTIQDVTICENALPYSWNNRSLIAAGTYTTTLTNINGCDSTVTLNLTVNPNVSSTQNVTICENALPYNWNNRTLTTAGTYTAILKNINGCDSTVTLHLAVHPNVTSTQEITICQNALPYSWNDRSLIAAGTYTTTLKNINGCDSTVTLNLAVHHNVSSTQNVTICENALPYSWNNRSLIAAGTYTTTLKSINGCDSTVTLNLAVNSNVTSTQNITVCENALPYSWNNRTLTTAGTYTAILKNINGCDSTVTLNLAVNSTVTSTQNVTICENALPYSWNNRSLTSAGTYITSLTNITGCDSTVTLNLDVNSNVTSTQNITICENALPYSWNNRTLTTAGTYTAILKNVNGCDSVVTLNLTVNPNVTSTQEITICENALPYNWNNRTLTTSGTYTAILKNINGCDSTVTLHLAVHPNVSTTQNVTICQNALPYSWNNRSLIAAGTYTTTLTNINGCDSTVTLNLTVNPNVSSTQNVTICENALPYNWNNRTLTTSGTYTAILKNVNGCDSTVTLNLAVYPTVSTIQDVTICENALPYYWNNRSLIAAGTYTTTLKNINGCDSTVTFNLTVNPDVSSTQNVTICENALPYNWNNRTLTTAGTYNAILKNVNGCDSTVTLHLAVHPNVSSTQNVTICENALPYSWNNRSLIAAGTYTTTLKSINGCDSTVTLNLAVNSNVTSTQNITVCENALPYNWNNRTLTTAGTYTAILKNINGCDSTVTLNLAVNSTFTSTQNVTVCENALPYSWNNRSLTSAGTYITSLTNITGCDSTVTLNLDVNSNVTSTQNITICENALPYSWNNRTLTTAGTYTAILKNINGCDSTVTLDLAVNSTVTSTQNVTICENALPYSWNNRSLTSAGTYITSLTNITGCDSTVTLNLDVNSNVTSTQNITICENALPYSWNNRSLIASGTYTTTLKNINGCDSVVTLNLTVNPNVTSTQEITICENALPYSWNNRSLIAAGTYTTTLKNINGCDSTVTLHLAVNPNISSIQNVTICENALPYSWNNHSLTAAGTYTATLKNINGCDSVVILNLTVNPNVSNTQNVRICENALPYNWNNRSITAAGTYTATLKNINGCDSTVTLNLTVNPNVSSTQEITICENALPYNWNNRTLTNAGTYTATLKNVNGCDSTVTLHLAVNPNVSSTQNVTVCENALPYNWNNRSLTTSGTYTATLKNFTGCDSTVTLNLAVHPNVSSTQNVTICENALPYSWNNRSLIAAGTYTTTLKNINGCDSTVTLDLTVNPNVSSTQGITICENALPYSWNNLSLIAAGTYTTTLKNINGCDSTVTLHLAVNPTVSTIQDVTICENALPYKWNNRTLTTAGTYTAILKSINGCDSVVTLNLNVNPNVTSTQEITICENALPFNWNNRTLTTAGTYTTILKNVNGCDSTVTLNLAVNSTVTSTQNITICENALPYSWNNRSLIASGTYTTTLKNINGCDSVVTLNLNVNPNVTSTQEIRICQNALPYSWNDRSLIAAGTYTTTLKNINGCDSTVTLNLAVNPTVSTIKDVTICENALPYNWNNRTLTTAGTYTAILKNVNGCDSMVTLNLAVHPNVSTIQDVTICENALPYYWNNRSLIAAGTYTTTLKNINGCDSTVTLNLAVNSNVTSTQNIKVCENALPYSWNNRTLTTPGTYTAILKNVNGCDSTVTLNLAVHPNVSSTQEITICENALPYNWNNRTLTTAGTYTTILKNINGCDSTVTLHLAVHTNVSTTQNVTICENALPYSWNNRSLIAAGTYTTTLKNVNGCDSTVTLNLAVHPNVSTIQDVTICENALPYSWNNRSLTAAGTYTTTLKSINGCDSTVTLNLAVHPNVTSTQNVTVCENALPYNWNNRSLTTSGTYTATLKNFNGCDSAVTLNLAVHPNVSTTQNVTICENALPYNWNNRSITAAGTYTTTLKNINSCDSTVTLNLAVNSNVTSTQNITVCENALPYSWNNRTLTTAGTYTTILKNVNGCDSAVTLNLAVHPNVSTTQNVTICENALPYNWNNRSITAAGTYTTTLKNFNSCDSTVTLNLAVNSNVTSTQNITVCENALPYSWNNRTLTTAGTYTAILKNVNGCDSTVTLNLAVNPNFSTTQNVSICEAQLPYSWNGQTLFKAGSTTALLKNVHGCDSLVTLHLAVSAAVSGAETVAVCASQIPFTWNGQTLNNPGTAMAVLKNIAGCDSIATLNLVIRPVATSEESARICPSSLPYRWNDITIHSGGDFIVTLISHSGCDSIATLHLIVNPVASGEETVKICPSSLPFKWNNQTINEGGNYSATLTSYSGCDSIATLHLIVNPVASGEETVKICPSSLPFKWNNQTINEGGNYSATLTSYSGCDSIATLHLIVHPVATGEETVKICSSTLPFKWNNQTINEGGNYSATLTSYSGCDSIATLHLIVNPVATGEETVKICSSTIPFKWNNQTINEGGNYSATLTSYSGCDSIATLHLIVNPVATGEETITLCPSSLPFKWNNQSINKGGNYSATLTSYSGCDSIATLHITVDPTPLLVTSPILTCTTANLTTASVTAGSDAGLSFTYWLDKAASTSLPDPKQVLPGVYYIKAINSYGCSSIAAATVSMEPVAEFTVTNPSPVCEPATIDLTAGNITMGSDSRLTFTYWKDAAATVPLVNPQAIGEGGTYYIKAIAAGPCSFEMVKEVAVSILKADKPIRYSTASVAEAVPFQLIAREPGLTNTYTWLPNQGLNFYDQKDPVFRYNQSIQFTVTIVPDKGCPVTDTILVTVIPKTGSCVSDIFVPSGWTPNKDGRNDNLAPLPVCIRDLKFFRIYNRWGQLMYETNIIGQGWDGRFHGEPQPPDSYAWSVEGLGEDGRTIRHAGYAVLIR